MPTEVSRGRSTDPSSSVPTGDDTINARALESLSADQSDGSFRNLGIPNVVERLIQQAILQVLTPIFDPGFSDSSFGFRPKRSAHRAVKQVQHHEVPVVSVSSCRGCDDHSFPRATARRFLELESSVQIESERLIVAIKESQPPQRTVALTV